MMLQYLDTIIAFVVIILGVSLLITILNQMISALIGYRGTNLLWGIRILLSTIEPNLTNNAESIAAQLLRKPIISDSIFSFSKFKGWLPKRWNLASAITIQELVRGLSNMAQTMAKESDKISDEKKEEEKENLKRSAGMIEGVLRTVDPEADRRAKMVLEILNKLYPNITIQMDKLIQELASTVQGPIGKLETCFETLEKRTSQKFSSQMRIWTIVFAVLFAFGANLDSFEIFKQLWTSPELRTSLVSDRETILKEASVVLSIQGGIQQISGPGVPPQILGNAMKNLKEIEKEAPTGLTDAPEFTNLIEALDWIRKNLKGDENLKRKLADEYRKLVLTQLGEQAEKLRQELAKSGFQLRFVTSWDMFTKLFSMPGLMGILVTTGFLCLGAPFWFNALKTLSNLRPLVANSTTKAAIGSVQS